MEGQETNGFHTVRHRSLIHQCQLEDVRLQLNHITCPRLLLGFPYILWHREGHPKRFNWIVTGVSQCPATDYWHGSGQREGWGKQGHIAKFDDLLTFWRINLEATSIEIWIMIPHWLIYSSVYCSNCWKNWYTCKIDHNRLSYRHTINIPYDKSIRNFKNKTFYHLSCSEKQIPANEAFQLTNFRLNISKNRKNIWGKFGCVFNIVGPDNLIKFQLTQTNFDCVWGSLILKRPNSSASTQVCL